MHSLSCSEKLSIPAKKAKAFKTFKRRGMSIRLFRLTPWREHPVKEREMEKKVLIEELSVEKILNWIFRWLRANAPALLALLGVIVLIHY